MVSNIVCLTNLFKGLYYLKRENKEVGILVTPVIGIFTYFLNLNTSPVKY
jgi:hypothetical protein